MKLVTPREGKDGAELPAAETCALDDDDEDEEEELGGRLSDFESVQFKESKGVKFFSKIKNMAGNKNKVRHVTSQSVPPPFFHKVPPYRKHQLY